MATFSSIPSIVLSQTTTESITVTWTNVAEDGWSSGDYLVRNASIQLYNTTTKQLQLISLRDEDARGINNVGEYLITGCTGGVEYDVKYTQYSRNSTIVSSTTSTITVIALGTAPEITAVYASATYVDVYFTHGSAMTANNDYAYTGTIVVITDTDKNDATNPIINNFFDYDVTDTYYRISTGIDQNREFSVHMYHTSDIGNSALSSGELFTSELATVGSVSALSGETGQITVSWEGLSSSLTFVHYEIHVSSNHTTFAQVGSNIPAVGLGAAYDHSVALTGLTNGTALSYKIVAVESTADPDVFYKSTSATVTAIPYVSSVISDLAVEATSTGVVVSWSATAGTYNPSFVVNRTATGVNESVDVAFVSVTLPNCSYTFSTWNASLEYTYTVTAYSHAGTDSTYITTPAIVSFDSVAEFILDNNLTAAACSAPTSVVATSGADTDAIEFDWSASNGTVDTYEIRRTSDNGVVATDFTSISKLVDGYADLATGEFYVVAKTSSGVVSPPSNIVRGAVYTLPVLSDIVLTSSGTDVTISWSVTENSFTLFGYKITRNGGDGGDVVQYTTTDDHDSVFASAQIGVTYAYSIQVYSLTTNVGGSNVNLSSFIEVPSLVAFNGSGATYVLSEDSLSSASISAPVIGNATSGVSGEISITWNGVTDATEYQVRNSDTNATIATVSHVGAANSQQSYTHTNLTDGDIYKYVIVAANDLVVSPRSDIKVAIAYSTTSISEADIVLAHNNATSIVASWPAVVHTLQGGNVADIVYYVTAVNGVTTSRAFTTNLSYTFTGMSNANDITVTVYPFIRPVAGHVTAHELPALVAADSQDSGLISTGHLAAYNNAAYVAVPQTAKTNLPTVTGVSATDAETAQTTVSWNTATGASSYAIYDSSSNTVLVTGITALSSTVTGLTNGALRNLYVVAVASNTVSLPSNSVTALPFINDSAVSSEAFVINDGSVDITFTHDRTLDHGFGVGAYSYNISFTGVKDYDGSAATSITTINVPVGVSNNYSTNVPLANRYYIETVSINVQADIVGASQISHFGASTSASTVTDTLSNVYSAGKPIIDSVTGDDTAKTITVVVNPNGAALIDNNFIYIDESSVTSILRTPGAGSTSGYATATFTNQTIVFDMSDVTVFVWNDTLGISLFSNVAGATISLQNIA